MVMFREDDERMKAMEKAEKLARRTPLGRWIRRIFKGVLILGVFAGLCLTMLSAVGGDHAALRKGIEDYLVQTTGMETDIGTFTHMKFFPALRLDAADISFRSGGEDKPVATLGAIRFSAGFFDMILARRSFGQMEFEKLDISPGLWGRRELSISFFGLQPDVPPGGPALAIAGRYGEKAIAGRMTVERDENEDGKVSYRLSDSAPFDLRYGDLHLAGTADMKKGGGVVIHIDRLEAPDVLLSGETHVTRAGKKIAVDAALTFGGSTVKADLRFAGGQSVEGSVTFPVLQFEDLALLQRIIALPAALPPEREDEGTISLSGLSASVAVAVTSLQAGDSPVGTVSFPLSVKDGVFDAGPLKGTINGGALSGHVKLDGTKSPAALHVTADVKGWDFGHFQRAVSGTEKANGNADLHVKAQSEAARYDGLLPALSGEAMMVSGQGKLTDSVVNLWGAGLVNTMLPSLNPDEKTTLNCIIADFKIDKGVAVPQPLFIDTSNVTVTGEGKIDLAGDRIDLMLKPKAKTPALLDIAVPVNVGGTVFAPTLHADGFSLLEKIGGVALGFVNPAFWAFSLTDLGLGENHPCREFIGDQKEDGKKAP